MVTALHSGVLVICMLSCRFYDFPVRIYTAAVIMGGIGGYYPAKKEEVRCIHSLSVVN